MNIGDPIRFIDNGGRKHPGIIRNISVDKKTYFIFCHETQKLVQINKKQIVTESD
jgi:hypothetical protein